MTDETPSAPPEAFTRPVELARLPKNAPYPFEIEANGAECAALARLFGARAVRKLRFTGRLLPLDGEGWRLEADLGATVIQSCVITLDPVTTRIDTAVRRRFVPGTQHDEEDDEMEPLAPVLDLAGVAIEAVSLDLPDYPRAEDAALDQKDFAGPGVEPMTDEDVKPFAGLKALRDKLAE